MPATNDWLENLAQKILNNIETYQEVKYPIYVPSKARGNIK